MCAKVGIGRLLLFVINKNYSIKWSCCNESCILFYDKSSNYVTRGIAIEELVAKVNQTKLFIQLPWTLCHYPYQFIILSLLEYGI